MQRVGLAMVVAFAVLLTSAARAAPIVTGTAPIGPGTNVLAGAAVNDSPGSSDLTLIVQLEADGDLLIDEGHDVRAIQPLENIPDDGNPTGWTEPRFDDSDWIEGQQGFGYADGDDNLIIGDGQHPMVYGRMYFEVGNPSSIRELRLGVDWDDGFVIWINGVEVARENGTDIPDLPEWDSWTDEGSGHSHEASKVDPPAYSYVELDVEVVGSPLSVDPNGKTATTWGDIKQTR